MAGFVHRTHNNAARADKSKMYIEEAPLYGHGFYYYNPALQNVDQGLGLGLTTPHYAVFNGLGVNGNGYSQPVQHQMHYNRLYNSANRSNGSGTWVQVGPNPYYMHRGTQTLQGNVVQRGSFNGCGMGATLFGHFSVSGDIN